MSQFTSQIFPQCTLASCGLSEKVSTYFLIKKTSLDYFFFFYSLIIKDIITAASIKKNIAKERSDDKKKEGKKKNETIEKSLLLAHKISL